MFIDKNTGAIELRNGFFITTELSKAGFEISEYFAKPHIMAGEEYYGR